MSLVTVNHVRFGHGVNILLEDVVLGVDEGQKIGLVGRNGCGKSTLLKIIAGRIQPDHGSVGLQRGIRIGYLEQEPKLDPSHTLRSAAAAAFGRLDEIQKELDEVFEGMATAQGAELDRLMARQVLLESEFDRLGGHATDHKVDAVLHGLNFVDAQFSTPVTSLSGGQRARLGLAKLLLEQPDLLMLDEPTNHLDIDGRRWLEDFLADEFKGAVLVVSHDRWLLDRVVHRIVEIDQGVIHEYPGNYADFVNLRRERMELQARVHEKQQDRIRAETEYILRYKAGQRAKQARGRATRLERYKESELVERPMELDAMDIDLPRAPELGDRAIEAHGLGKSYGARTLFSGLDVLIKPGERIGIIGPNGCGKSTLVKILLGELEPDGGEIKRAPRLRSGWFRQTHDHLDGSLTVWQYLQQAVPPRSNGMKLNEQEARNLAGAFLFSGEAQEKPLGALSGGERTRAVIAGLVAGANNILVLDEPTNHLDIPSAERLEQSLAPRSEHGGYDGALLLISHDRALLETTCDRLIAFDGEGHVEFFQGRYSEWEAKRTERAKEAESRRRAEAERDRRKAAQATAPAVASPASAPATPAKAAAAPAQPAKAAPSAKSPAPKGAHSKLSDEKLNAEIAKATDRMEALDAALADPAVYRDGDKVKRLNEERSSLQARLSELEDEWLRRAS